ncbi:hypothetical protein [Streptomyces sp. KL116D]
MLHDFDGLAELMRSTAVTVTDLPPAILGELDADAFRSAGPVRGS